MSFSHAYLASMSPAPRPLGWVLALAFCGAAAHAQSLPEIVDTARTYDATYLGARSMADAARYRYEQARALHMPSANLVVTGGRNISSTPYAVAEGGVSASTSNSASAKLTGQ